MHLTIPKFNLLAVVVAIFGLALGTVVNIGAQTTNSIPSNIFLTDDGKLFWYKPGERLIDTKKITAAKNSDESRPANQDPEGYWGQVTNGLQLSLRFKKQTFTNGEAIVATILMRNVTNNLQTYFRPAFIVAMKDGKLLKRKKDSGFKQITVSPESMLFPQTQHKYQEILNQHYDLNESGEYIFFAECKRPEITSQQVNILVTNVMQLK